MRRWEGCRFGPILFDAIDRPGLAMIISLAGSSGRSMIRAPMLFVVAIWYCLHGIGGGKCRASFKRLEADTLVCWVTADGRCWIAMVVAGRHGEGRECGFVYHLGNP